MNGTSELRPADALSREIETGAVRLSVHAWPAKPRLGDPIHLELEASAPPEVELMLPEFGEALDRFEISGFSQRRADRGDRQVWIQHYTLQATHSGRQVIPPLLVEFVDHRPGAPPPPEGLDAHELLTEGLALEVASAFPPGEAPPALRAPAPALPLYRPGTASSLGPALAGLAAVLLAVILWRALAARRRRRRRLSAYDIAASRLERLLRAGPPRDAGLDPFFVELSAIVRRYLEDRFELRAPEMTTEEFLAHTARTAVLTLEQRRTLQDFLRPCDLVKFAAHRPGQSEIDEAVAVARAFLSETRPQSGQAREVAHA